MKPGLDSAWRILSWNLRLCHQLLISNDAENFKIFLWVNGQIGQLCMHTWLFYACVSKLHQCEMVIRMTNFFSVMNKHVYEAVINMTNFLASWTTMSMRTVMSLSMMSHFSCKNPTKFYREGQCHTKVGLFCTQNTPKCAERGNVTKIGV